MSRIRTPICDLLGIEYPIFSAGMGVVAGPTLAAAVSNAGGLGVIGATGMNAEALREAIKKTREMTDRPFGVDLLLPADLLGPPAAADRAEREVRHEGEPGPRPRLEIPERQQEFIEALAKEWNLPELPESGARRGRRERSGESVREQVQVVLDERVPVFAAGLGDPAWLVPDAHERGIIVMTLVGNVRNAKRVAAGGTDILIAQGHEAGGHTGRIGTMALVPQVVDAVAPRPVVAAGGIADGRGVAAAICLGAVGVWCGTAFLAAEESFVDVFGHQADAEWRAGVIKKKIVDATDESTRISRAITGKTARLIDTPFVQAWERPDAPPTLPLPLQGVLVNRLLRRINLAKRDDLATEAMGQIAGMIDRIKPAAEVVSELVEGAERVLAELTKEKV